MDEVAQYNQARWKALANANALFTRARLDLDPESSRRIVDPEAKLGDFTGKDVLCLAGGGGRQSAAYGVLGARVTVVDLSAEQLDRDREVADHYDLEIRTIWADMRDISFLDDDSFDLVDHAYSINFVPECLEVFKQVARVLRPGGYYKVMSANPFTAGIEPSDWNGSGYVLREPYVDGASITYADQDWVYDVAFRGQIPAPMEYKHSLSKIVNGLSETGFSIVHLSDNADMHPDLSAEPGSWDHLVAHAPPWFVFLTRLQN